MSEKCQDDIIVDLSILICSSSYRLILAIRGVGIENACEIKVVIYLNKPSYFIHSLENLLLQVSKTRQKKCISYIIHNWRTANYSEYKENFCLQLNSVKQSCALCSSFSRTVSPTEVNRIAQVLKGGLVLSLSNQGSGIKFSKTSIQLKSLCVIATRWH